MNRAYATLAGACAVAATAVVYAHWSQISERERMHAGVLRDIAKEQQQQQQQALEAAAKASALAADCESGVCDLASTRFRDPTTGQVYVPAVVGK